MLTHSIHRTCLQLGMLMLVSSCSQTNNAEGSGSGGSTLASQGGGNGSSGGSSGSGAGGSSAAGGRAGSGGNSGTGGAATGGTRSSGGAAGSGGESGGGSTATGGSSGAGGSSARGGSSATGGSSARGGSSSGGGASGSGGSQGGGGAVPSGGSSSSGGSTGSGGAVSTDCAFTIVSNAISTKMATVGVVEWSTTLANVSKAQIVYTLNNAGANILNKGGTAPVDLKKSSYHTLLLGLKQSSDYTFHIEATSSDGKTCKSSDYPLPKTGSLSGAPTLTRTAGSSTSSQDVGFVVTCTGIGSGGGMGGGGSSTAYIFDADGAVVWSASAPGSCSRARMDYEGVNMWMMALNVQNSGGEMRYLSMDGQSGQNNISGLSSSHHDFCVMPGKVATMVWASSGSDPESNLVEHASDGSGSSTTVFKIGSNLYVGGQSALGGGNSSYHCNSIMYHADDDTYTIGDRNPNLYVKVKHDGTPVWQVGGSCTNAPASKCASGTWKVNHGHDFDRKNGNMLIFNNGSSGSAHILELALNTSGSTFSYTTVKDFSSGGTSNTLGDVQRLPSGNTMITYSNSSQLIEVDSSWNTVQTLKGSFGYAEWRETLYGPPQK
jgi:hypothetical protein